MQSSCGGVTNMKTRKYIWKFQGTCIWWQYVNYLERSSWYHSWMWCGRRKPSAGSCRGQSHPPEVCEVYFSVKIHLGLRKTSSNSCSTLIFRTTRNDWRCPQCKPQLLYPLPSPSRVSLLWNLFFPISIVIEFLWRKYNVQCNAMLCTVYTQMYTVQLFLKYNSRRNYFTFVLAAIQLQFDIISIFYFKYCLENEC